MKITKAYFFPVSKLTSSLTLGAVLIVNSANAQIIIYNNLGAAYTGNDPLTAISPAYDSFTSAASSQALTGLGLKLMGPGGGVGTLTVGLYQDLATSPGTLITTLGTIADISIASGVNDYTLSLISNPVLAPSTRYWIGLTDTTGSESWAWSLDVSGVGVGFEYLVNNYNPGKVWPNNPNGPYQMEVITNVPEPSSLALAGLSGLSLMLFRRQRK
jgi:hypothetical protein